LIEYYFVYLYNFKNNKMKDTLKSIAISKETHTLVKEYCDKRALKIRSWIDNVLRREIKNQK